MPNDPPVLVTDLDGVIRCWPSELSDDIERRWSLAAGSILKAAFGDAALLEKAITGQITDEAWRAQIAEHLSVEHARDVRPAVAEWALSPGVVIPAGAAAIRRIGEVADVILFTNATTRLLADLAALGLQDCFTAVVNSASLGVAKPERAAFAAVMAIAQRPADQLVFVDDSMPNVVAAAALGIKAHLFTGTDCWPDLIGVFDGHGPSPPGECPPPVIKER